MAKANGESLLSMAEAVAQVQGRYHPGRPAFSALSRAHDALRDAAREVAAFEQVFGPKGGAAPP
jgi:hypothetical protein